MIAIKTASNGQEIYNSTQNMPQKPKFSWTES